VTVCGGKAVKVLTYPIEKWLGFFGEHFVALNRVGFLDIEYGDSFRL
jgi:hypothetical protein